MVFWGGTGGDVGGQVPTLRGIGGHWGMGMVGMVWGWGSAHLTGFGGCAGWGQCLAYVCTFNWSSQPSPGWLLIVSVPPMAWARSRIPWRPKPVDV